MYKFKVGVSAQEHDKFVESHPFCNLLQSSNWAKIKDNWDHEIVGVYDDDQLVASSLVLIKHLPLNFTMMYTPRGPIMDYENERLVKFFMQEIKKFAKEHKCLFIKMDPGIHVNDYPINEPNDNKYDVSTILNNMQKAGAIHQGYVTNLADAIQPRFQANVYYDENFKENLPKKTKRFMKDAIKHHVEYRQVDISGIQDFSKVMALTEERKNISLRNEDYFKHLKEVYGDDCWLILGYVNVKALLDELYEKKRHNDEEIANVGEQSRKKLNKLQETAASINKQIQDFEPLLEKYPEEACVAGILNVKFGETLDVLYAGMDDNFKKCMPQYYLYVTLMEYAFNNGVKFVNMGGVEGDLSDGLSHFKAKFNPMINEFIGEFDLPVNKVLYKASQLAYKLRKKH